MEQLNAEQTRFLIEHGRRLGLYTGMALSRLPLPPRQRLMGAWLVEESYTLLYAPRGLGKTQFLLGAAIALAKGQDFLGYHVPEPVRVLVMDGEMSPAELKERLHVLSNGDVPSDNLLVISTMLAERPWGLLNDYDERRELMEVITAFKPQVVMLDNKSCLFDVSRENDAESWQEVSEWLGLLVKARKAVILAHHTGKNGTQRGTSFAEGRPTAMIRLKAPPEGVSKDGTRFVLDFEKARHFYGPDAQSLSVSLSTANGQAVWDAKPIKLVDERVEQAKALAAEGVSQRDISKQLGVGLGTVNRLLKNDDITTAFNTG